MTVATNPSPSPQQHKYDSKQTFIRMFVHSNFELKPCQPIHTNITIALHNVYKHCCYKGQSTTVNMLIMKQNKCLLSVSNEENTTSACAT